MQQTPPAPFTRLFAAFALVLVGACASPKQTWDEWVADPDSYSPEARAAVPTGELTPTVKGPVVYAEPYQPGDAAGAGEGFDLAMRNPDFPRTHIAAIYIDLTRPDRHVRLRWAGPLAAQGPVGPWHSRCGRGKPGVDCNDVETSNTKDTLCTPKGVFPVAGFADHLYFSPYCHYVTWVVHWPRYIGIHSHPDFPTQDSTAGCVRVPYDAAKLIHNNSLTGTTLIKISGNWAPLPE